MPATSSYTVEDYETLLVALQDVYGIVVPEEQRGMMVQRLVPILPDLQLETLNDLARCLSARDNQQLSDRVLSSLSHYSTGWHLNSELRSLLRDYVFEQQADGARMWVVGCGKGELAWSVAMELDDYEHQNDDTTDISIVASDSLAEDIEKAGSANYNEMELDSLGEGFRQLYFAPADNGNGFMVKNRIRDRVEFSQCDLMKGCQQLGQFDVILCPQVLAYLSNGVRAAALQAFAGMLKPGGILIVGSQQNVPPGIGLERVNHPAGVFYRHH